ncbi:hypothetical protein SAMN05444266_105211 [Chitinophaga jiangningensis]|uniref:Outer membrane lipoprotein-sorting protein n=1 Tax=Chitinophaga jiangningensis TaxID=1419482 RepID=A0A1M7DZS2_9BACT|nr:hypothetical protein [Chitinophaga jiangningensis]SHL84957.1 hypothetical protein SAMN05444266_105211 [Chitinophaga jiangningensis]
MRNHPAFYLLASLLAFTACSNITQKPVTGQPDKYIDLPGYFKSEEKLLVQSGSTMEKRVLLNGQSTEATFDSKDSNAVQHLLKPFLDIDLNKPSLRDAYDTTSLTDPFSGRKSVIYKSKGEQTSPEEITMELDKNGTIQQVTVQSYTSNMVYEYRQHLIYQRGKSILINTYQKIAFLSPKELEISVKAAGKNQL